MRGVELPEYLLRGRALQLGVQCPVAVELEVGVLAPGIVPLDDFPDSGQQVDGLDLGLNPRV